MDTPMTILSKALQADEIDKIPSYIANKLEKYLMGNQILYDKPQDNNETLRLEIRQQTANADKIEARNDDLLATLRFARSTICELNATNQSLKNRCEEIAVKLKDHTLESGKLIQHYQNELNVKIKLSDLYKENSDDYQAQANELSQAVKEIQRMLFDTTDQCGKFETELKGINEVHKLALDEKKEEIAKLKEELKVANEMLKTAEDKNAERIFIPSASVVNRRLKSGISFTEMCTLYYKLVEELKNKEQNYNHLKLEFESIFQQVKEKSFEVERQLTKYKKTVAINEKLKEEIDAYIAERVLKRAEYQEIRSKYGHLERENVKLKRSTNDLARQVVYLMAEIEGARGGTSSDHDQSIMCDTPANEAISKKLVTFNNIVEMQDNNQKLLYFVRDLSTKLEEMAEIQNSVDIESYEAKVASYEKRLHDAEESRRANEDLLANCIKDRDRFKRLYRELMKDICKKPVIGDEMEGMDDDMDAACVQSSSKEARERKLADVEQSLQDKIRELKELKNKCIKFRNDSKNNVRSLHEQRSLKVRNEWKKLSNCK